MTARDMESRFLGSLLGLAIGDALGMPIGTMTREDTVRDLGRVETYLPGDPGTDQEIPAGEITDETEMTLCIVESMTTNNGQVDAENINARLLRLVEGPSRHWMPGELQDGILEAANHDGQVPGGFERPAVLAAGVMGVPIGLMHGVGALDPELVRRDARTIASLTNTQPGHRALVEQVAGSVLTIVRGERVDIASEDQSAQHDRVNEAGEIFQDVMASRSFEEVVIETVNRRRPADSAGALAGAFAGARFGAGEIPQWMIDGLESRVYLTLAAPWFYRTATRRAGTVIDLRPT